jgi:hypothetical protein
MEYRPYSAQTTKDLRILAERHGAGTILELTPEELRRSASRWTHRHLIAYRLLTQPEQATLPILALTHDQCPQCNERSPVQSINRIWTGHLTGDTPKRLTARTESELAALPGGFFWIALARAARREPPGEGHVYPERDRKPVDRQEYVNSTRVIDGSSSPPAPPSSSGFEVSFSDIDEDEHHVRRNQPEEVTVCLATSFLQYALSLCLLQAPEATTELRVRVERMTAVAQIAGAVHLVAEDDGGICSMHRVKEGWSMEHPWLALLEAKRAFKHVGFNSGSGEYTPIVTNENLAQYLGEAVITWKANRENDNKNIQDEYGQAPRLSHSDGIANVCQCLSNRGSQHVYQLRLLQVQQ